MLPARQTGFGRGHAGGEAPEQPRRHDPEDHNAEREMEADEPRGRGDAMQLGHDEADDELRTDERGGEPVKALRPRVIFDRTNRINRHRCSPPCPDPSHRYGPRALTARWLGH